MVFFESVFGGPDKYILSFRFSFSNKGNRSVCMIFVLLVFAVCCFQAMLSMV